MRGNVFCTLQKTFLHCVDSLSFLCPVQVDYLIIGQGIAGTFLSWYLLNARKKIAVIDEQMPNSASKVAGGIINPTTGRRIVKSWLIDELIPHAWQAYNDIGADLNIKAIRQVDMLSFHPTDQMAAAWHEKVVDGEDYISNVHHTVPYSKYFNFHHGIGLTSPCLLVDLPVLLPAWRKRLKASGALIEARFEIGNCRVCSDSITYNDISAEKIIFCNGMSVFDVEYFSKLPFAPSKGEVLIAKIPGLPTTNIYKQGINIIPLNDDYFWIGSSFEWDFIDVKPSEKFRQTTLQTLERWLKLPVGVVDTQAAIRPGSLDRRPFVGLHPVHPAVCILGGLGTKGCSLAPFFASQLTSHLLYGNPIHELADIQRFKKLLSA